MAHLLRAILGLALCAAAGAGFVARRRISPADLPEWLARSAAVGMALLVPALVLLGLANVPVGPATIALLAAAFAALGLATSRARFESPPPEPAPRFGFAALVPGAAFGVFAWKVASVPVWCWDHYVVWGMKSRVMLSGGVLDLAFLRAVPFSAANADYPVGLPMIWRILTLGAEPSAPDVKIAHLVFGAGVLLAVAGMLREAGAEGAWPDAAAGLAAISPLFWDTESLGIAEMPLAWFALTALGLLFGLARRRCLGAFAAGAALGFLPWIKKEGGSLALLIAGAALLLGRSARPRTRLSRFAAAAAVAAVSASVALGIERTLLPRGVATSFFVGDWSARVRDRIAHPLSVAAPLVRELATPIGLAFGAAFVLALAAALERRRREALAAFGVLFGQAALYVPVYFATYLEPAAHIRASLPRLLAALLPIGAVGIGLAAGGPVGEDALSASADPSGRAGPTPPRAS